MKRVSINKTGLLVLLLILIVSCVKKKQEDEGLPFINTPEFTPEWISTDNPNYNKIHTIPAFSFTNQDGEIITDKTVEGKIYCS